MSIRLSDLMEETKEKYELRLIAGEKGLDREMTWVYVAEDQTNAGFLRPGELIISTGALYDHTEQWLLTFIRTLWEKRTCGLILNVGKHLSAADVTEPILRFCDRRGFPLFLMPWHIHIYDITKDYYDRIFADMRLEESPDFFRLLAQIENPAVLDRFVRQKLGPVLDYDEKHGASLADTLFLYLKSWGNISETADGAYCHRNTVANRIRFITEQLGVSLEDPIQRFELTAAFWIREFNTRQKRT